MAPPESDGPQEPPQAHRTNRNDGDQGVVTQVGGDVHGGIRIVNRLGDMRPNWQRDLETITRWAAALGRVLLAVAVVVGGALMVGLRAQLSLLAALADTFTPKR